MKYDAMLTNPKPPGEIHSVGSFGPWDSDEPGAHLWMATILSITPTWAFLKASPASSTPPAASKANSTPSRRVVKPMCRISG